MSCLGPPCEFIQPVRHRSDRVVPAWSPSRDCRQHSPMKDGHEVRRVGQVRSGRVRVLVLLYFVLYLRRVLGFRTATKEPTNCAANGIGQRDLVEAGAWTWFDDHRSSLSQPTVWTAGRSVWRTGRVVCWTPALIVVDQQSSP